MEVEGVSGGMFCWGIPTLPCLPYCSGRVYFILVSGSQFL